MIKKAQYNLIKLITELISNDFVDIAKDCLGTYALQALLDKINTDELKKLIINSISGKEYEMAVNSNATYVLQKIIEIAPDTNRMNINNLIIEKMIEFSTGADCVFIIEKFISIIKINEIKIKIYNMILKNFETFVSNAYGNYIIQFLFQTWSMKDLVDIIE